MAQDNKAQSEIRYLNPVSVDVKKKKYCRFKKLGIKYVDYKDGEFLKKFLNEQGKILPRRLTGTSQKFQKKVAQAPKAKILLAMCGAFAFVLSALKIPSITGSCSHPTGVGLGAILFGPMTMAVLGLIVLLFQALLLAHGGLTTLGANTFSMAIAGPIVSWAVYKLLRKANAPAAVAVFAAAALGDLFTYVVTSVQLGVVNGGIGKFLMVFAVTQIPLAIAEGLLTVVVFNVLEKYSREELHALCVL